MTTGQRILAGVKTLGELLSVAGVSATDDPGRLQVPGVWMSPRTADVTDLDGGYTVSVDLYLIVSDSGHPLPALAKLLDQVLTVVDPDAPVDLAAPIRTSTSESALPAWRLTVDITV